VKTYTHNPTTVEAVQIAPPYPNVTRGCPFAHQFKSGAGKVTHYVVSPPGQEPFRAYPGDWILHYPTGCWAVQTVIWLARTSANCPTILRRIWLVPCTKPCCNRLLCTRLHSVRPHSVRRPSARQNCTKPRNEQDNSSNSSNRPGLRGKLKK